MDMRGFFRSTVAVAAALGWFCAPAGALTIVVDYSYDTNGFFNPNVNSQALQARATLEKAVENFEMFTDHLPRIEEYGGCTWSAGFWHPGTDDATYVPGLVVPPDTLIVYVGGRDMGSSILGEAGPGFYSASAPEGQEEWFDLLAYRGQAGAEDSPATDFGLWGGSISFNDSADWSFDLYSAPADEQENDFFSVCLHEMCHMLGFGISDSWYDLLVAGTFRGEAAMDAYGQAVPLGGSSHWDFDVEGETGGQAQEAAMTPSLTTGTRKRLTDLDVAALDDIGWQMPETGDADLDGVVGAADFVTLKENMNEVASATWSDGDFDFDGQVTLRDLLLLEGDLSAGGVQQIPEPASLALLGMHLAALLRRRPASARRP